MSFVSWRPNRTSTGCRRARAERRRAAHQYRPRLVALGDRCLPSTYAAATVSDLIADINAANAAGGANTIVLTAPNTSPYALTAVNNTTDGPTMLPVISGTGKKLAADSLTIVGNGDTIDANQHGRLFDVASGASLSLQTVTLQNGYANGARAGGAIYNQGTLVLSGVAVEGNAAVGAPGGTINRKNKAAPAGWDAAGGGIWSNGSLTVENQSVIKGNSATGGAGGFNDATQQYGPGGNAFGGGVYIAGGTANITGSTIGIYYPLGGYGFGNTAQGGNGSVPGSAYGGGLYVAAGTVTMSSDAVESNQAVAGNELPNGVFTSADGYGGGLYVAGGTVALTNDYVDHNLAGIAGSNGQGGILYFGGHGGGIFIASGATVSLDSFTVTNTIDNTANTGTNIDGTYILLS